jgi:hypothetical protein
MNSHLAVFKYHKFTLVQSNAESTAVYMNKYIWSSIILKTLNFVMELKILLLIMASDM